MRVHTVISIGSAAAATILTLAGRTAIAQNQQGGPLDPDTPTYEWTPDRRPVMSIPLFNGNTNNPRGLSYGWYQHDADGLAPTQAEYDQAKALLYRDIAAGYADGWRRFNLYMPAGAACGQVFTGNQWTALPQWKKDLIADSIPVWFNDFPGATIGLYAGGLCSTEPASLCTGLPSSCSECSDPDQTFLPYASSGAGLTMLQYNALPYHAIGFSEYFIDAAATNPSELIAIFRHSSFYNVMRMGGEAIPVVPHTGGGYDPDLPPMQDAPWVCVNWFPWALMGGATDPRHVYDPETTEVGLWFDWTPLVPSEIVGASSTTHITMPKMRDLLAHGWVPWSGPDFDFATTVHRNELLKRIYSFGLIENIADFNFDGVVNSADYTEYVAAYFAHESANGNFIHGDMNGDGMIDPDDLGDFISAYTSGSPTLVDFGGPEPEYALVP